MKFDFISGKSPDSSYNEDLAYVGKNMAWILDGATPLTNTNYTKNSSDAVWLVKNLHEILLKFDGSSNPDLLTITKHAIITLRSQFDEFREEKILSSFEVPSCSLCIARWNRDETRLEYLILGDCEIAVFHDSNFKLYSDNALKDLDRKVIERMKTIQKKGYTHYEAFKMVQQDLMRNRSTMNKKEGYWTLSFDESAVDHSLNGDFSLKRKTAVLLSSDGINDLVGTSKIYNNWNMILDDIRSNGIKSILERIRNFELDDPECLKLPRIKKHDDASIVLLEFV